MRIVVPEYGPKQATWPAEAGLFLLAQPLRHFKMVLQVRQSLARPILQLRIVAPWRNGRTENIRWPSYRFYRASQGLNSPTCDICEIFEPRDF